MSKIPVAISKIENLRLLCAFIINGYQLTDKPSYRDMRDIKLFIFQLKYLYLVPVCPRQYSTSSSHARFQYTYHCINIANTCVQFSKKTNKSIINLNNYC